MEFQHSSLFCWLPLVKGQFADMVDCPLNSLKTQGIYCLKPLLLVKLIFMFVCKRLSVSRSSENLKVLISEKLQNGFLLYDMIIMGLYLKERR